MNTIEAENVLLLIIDVQEKLIKMINNPNIEKNTIILAKTAGILKLPVIITEQYPKGLGSTINEIKNSIDNAIYIEKTNFSAYKETNFIENIEKQNKKQIIIYGIETHICVLQTAFDLLNKGYEVFVVQDASGSRTDENKNAALRRLIHAGCQIVTTEMVIFELLKSSKNPNFKEIQSLIK
ncbi:hydrolase [bacterium]|nr:hydrolase [bacterium]